MTATFKKISQGFTLVELLVVIAILGVLAGSLVATIDPLEQIRKSEDSNYKNVSMEFLLATTRYYANNQEMMWKKDTNCLSSMTVGATKTLSALSGDCVYALISSGELKDVFTTATSITKDIYITAGTDNATACYQPKSLQEKKKGDLTKYSSVGVVNSDTANGTKNSSSYACFIL